MKFNFESWEEFLDWNVKRENHIKELKEETYQQGLEILRLKREIETLKKSPAATEDEE